MAPVTVNAVMMGYSAQMLNPISPPEGGGRRWPPWAHRSAVDEPLPMVHETLSPCATAPKKAGPRTSNAARTLETALAPTVGVRGVEEPPPPVPTMKKLATAGHHSTAKTLRSIGDYASCSSGRAYVSSSRRQRTVLPARHPCTVPTSVWRRRRVWPRVSSDLTVSGDVSLVTATLHSTIGSRILHLVYQSGLRPKSTTSYSSVNSS